MPILDAQCIHCKTERETIIFKNRSRAKTLNCEQCKKVTLHTMLDRHYAAALRFVDGVSQWESNEKKAKALREGKH